MAKFFSGKIPYDANVRIFRTPEQLCTCMKSYATQVLHTLDNVLDKTIDYFRTNKTNLDPEIREIIEKRETVRWIVSSVEPA